MTGIDKTESLLNDTRQMGSFKYLQLCVCVCEI